MLQFSHVPAEYILANITFLRIAIQITFMP